MVSDNGPEFDNQEFKKQPKWRIEHLTSSKADGSAHTHFAANCWQVTPAKQWLEDHSEKPSS